MTLMLSPIDPVTAVVLGGCAGLLSAVVLALTRVGKPMVDRACRLLALGQLLIGAGMLSFLAKPLLPPALPGILVGHSVVAGAILWGLFFCAINRAGPPSMPLRILLGCAFAAMPIAALTSERAFDFCYPAVMLVITLTFYFHLRRRIGSSGGRREILLHVTLGALASTWLLRAWGSLAYAGPTDPMGIYLPFSGGPFLLIAYALVPLAMTTQVLMLLNANLRRELRDQAWIDKLTGVASRYGLAGAWPGITRRARAARCQIAVVLFDLDRFKSVNDSFGHLVGDDALRHVVEVALTVLRPGDVFGRYGGEEFVLLLPVHDLSEVAVVAERLRAAVEAQPCRVGKLELPLTISAGAAMWVDEEPLEATIGRADQRLYKAKAAGRNQVMVDGPIAA